VDFAHSRAKGRVVSVLEGGYDLGGLSRSVGAHVGVLMDAAS
jgi:acetoin utilization deacetylase AcuC-like enzyme